MADDTTGNGAASIPSNSGAYSAGNWQAIWSPAHNAYYFYDSTTRETTWVNPLQQSQQQAEDSKGKGKEKATSETEGDDDDEAEDQDKDDEGQGNVAGPSTNATATTPNQTQWEQMQANALAQGIDPHLAHLDPSLATGPSLPSGAFTARFNARTGAFTATDGRDPSHLSEYERAKRMSQFYFDVGAWEEELAQRDTAEEERKKKRKPTKKDLVSYPPPPHASLFDIDHDGTLGSLQRTEATEKDSKDRLASHIVLLLLIAFPLSCVDQQPLLHVTVRLHINDQMKQSKQRAYI
jgi:hypothetical protein